MLFPRQAILGALPDPALRGKIRDGDKKAKRAASLAMPGLLPSNDQARILVMTCNASCHRTPEECCLSA